VDYSMAQDGRMPSKETNKQARKDANKISDATVKVVRKQKEAAREAVRRARQQLNQMKREMDKQARNRLANEKKEGQTLIQSLQDALKREKLRVIRENTQAERDERLDENASQKETKGMIKYIRTQAHLVSKAGEQKIRRVKKNMREIMRGGDSHSLEWDAAQFKPKTKVMSNAAYGVWKAKKLAAKNTKKAAKKQKKAVLLQKQQVKKKLRLQRHQKWLATRKAKKDRVTLAMASYKKAKKALESAENDKPQGVGVGEFLRDGY